MSHWTRNTNNEWKSNKVWINPYAQERPVNYSYTPQELLVWEEMNALTRFIHNKFNETENRGEKKTAVGPSTNHYTNICFHCKFRIRNVFLFSLTFEDQNILWPVVRLVCSKSFQRNSDFVVVAGSCVLIETCFALLLNCEPTEPNRQRVAELINPSVRRTDNPRCCSTNLLEAVALFPGVFGNEISFCTIILGNLLQILTIIYI